MAAGDRIFMAKESTSQEILSNTKKIIEDAKAKPKRYGMRINLLDSNPATRVKYLYDAVGMTPAGMNFAGGGFDYGDWGDIWFVKKNRPVMVRTDGTVDYELNHENHALKLNGGASDITKTSYGGNAMSEIPLIWVKRWTQNNRCGVHKHRTDTVRNIRRLLFKNGNGIRHRKNPDRCIRK